MERELHGSVKVISMQKGHCTWKMGMARLVCVDKKWKLAVRLQFQVMDRYTWELKTGTKVMYKNQKSLFINMGNGDAVRMMSFDPASGNKFVENVNLILDKKLPVEDTKPYHDTENLPHTGPGKTTHHPSHPATRIPLSPKQPHTSKTSLNPTHSSARQNMSFLHQGQAKSAEKLSPFPSRAANFYGKGHENQRTYGALGVSSGPRLKRPGLMPNPERGSNVKRARNYDWGKKPSTPTKTELHGFSNLGNTCYMNAILQSLFHLPTFAADLRALFLKVGPNYPDNALFRALGSLLNAQRNDGSHERKRRCLSGIKNAISASAKRFSGYQQHDAHEFLGQVLDQLKDETIKLNKVKGQGSTEDDVKSDDPTTRTTPEGHNSSMEDTTRGATYENPTIKNFEFTVMHTIHCQACPEVVQKEETFHDLSLDIPRKVRCMGERTLQHALDQFFEDEKIEYTCEKCGSTDSDVQHKFTRLPRIMIMHLKRYSILQQGLFCGKSGGSTAIPRYITLRDHCTQETSPPFPPDLNHSYEAGSETKKHPEKLSYLLDQGEDTPSRRKLNFAGSFKQVKAHIQVDAARSLDDFTSEAKFSQERRPKYSSSGEDTDGVDKVQTLSEDIDMISDDELPIYPLRTQYSEPYKVAQMDGTMDPRDAEVSQGSLDEEDVRQLSEEEQMKLALSRSLQQTPKHSAKRHTETSPGEQSPPLRYPSDDEMEPEPATRRAPVDSVVGRSKTRRWSADSDSEVTFKDSNTVDFDEVSDGNRISESRESGSMGAGPKPLFPMFRNHLTPAKKKSGHGRVMHSTPNPESEHGTDTKSKEERLSPRGKVEPINLEDWEDEMTEEARLELEKDLFDDSPQPPQPPRTTTTTDQDSKHTPHVIGSDEDGLFASPVKRVQGQDKENMTPPRVDTTQEPDWIEKRREDAEKEDREFQEALQASLREQEDTEQREKEELRRATELSLREFNGDVLPVLDSDEEGSDTEGVGLYTPDQLHELRKNWRKGDLPYSYQLVSVVSHLGSSSNVGHYVCDALDIRKKEWSSYDDSHVSKTKEMDVMTSRQQTGYVFFYCAKELIEELDELYQNGLHERPT